MPRYLIALAASVLACVSLKTPAAGLLSEFEQRVTEFTLENGLHFIVVERHQAPVVSFHTYVDAGSVDEPKGGTGLAHMFEHMAFKGTTSIGSTDIEAELAAMRRADELFARLRRARLSHDGPPDDTVRELEKKFERAVEAAGQYVRSGAFEEILERQGARGLNAYTNSDGTGYMYSLPANRLELFFAMESDRFLHPVLREFYVERDVVMEERRQRVDSNPVGRLVEEALGLAFTAHPYGRPTIGYRSDLRNLSRPMARRFFDRHYRASNLTIGIAGDVEPERVRELAEEYFARLPGGEPPLPVTTEEPEQRGERRVVMHEQAQPYVLVGYHRPGIDSEDHAVYEVLNDVVSRGRTSRFHRNLVQSGLALQVRAVNSFPGVKYPTLFAILGVPNRGVEPGRLESAIYAELDALVEEGIGEEALQRAKTRARAALVGQLDSNSGLARRLAAAHALTGDWRDVFRRLDAIEAVTREDVKRLAADVFRRDNRTVALIANESGSGDAEPRGAGEP